LQVPYLLFYPDKNHDDIPDADPEVLLSGFGMEDAHSVVNSLIFGPDGWLYGCQGSTVTANIRGIEFQQGVWRYHPISKRFELFCEGGGNSWGLDFDEDGNLIYSTNLGPYRNLHGVQGGYYWKSFGKHGALHNPFTYGYFDHIAYANFTGGHVTDGGIIYQGDAFPEKFRGQYIANDLLGHAVQWHKMEKSGSTFKASYGGELLTPNDNWFAPSDLTMGPDGAIYVADWCDRRTAHPDPDADWDRSNGRIYRISYEGTNSSKTVVRPENLTSLPNAKLIELLSSKNDWVVRKARRILEARRDAESYPWLRAQVFESKDEHVALESFWALYASGGADDSFLNKALEHSSPKIRFWAVRLIGDAETVSPKNCQHLLEIAANEPDVKVRSQLASTAKRLPPSAGLGIVQSIALQNRDVSDPHIPLLLWWAVEKHCVGSVDETLDLFSSAESRQSALVREIILPRLIRRYAAEGTKQTLLGCARLFETSPENERGKMLESFALGVGEQPKNREVPHFDWLPIDLQKNLIAFWTEDTRNVTLIRLLARLGEDRAIKRAIDLADSKATATEVRVAMIHVLGEMSDVRARRTVASLSAPEQLEALQLAALDAMQQSANAPVESVLANYAKWNSHVRSKARDLLFSRPSSARSFLKNVESGAITSSEVPLDQLQKIALLNDKELNERVRKIWGNIGSGTPEEKLADIRRFNNDLRAFPGKPKNGHAVFTKTCAPCHELFGEGEKVGPELTHANRADKDFLLTSIVDPNAVVRKEFINYNIETSDGRVLNGLIVEQNANSITLAGAKNERTTINRSQIASTQESSVSLMPEGLMHALTPEERRDLFAYLQSTHP
jgi:putative membrane-bound dehydrogenase-like protein